MTRDEVLEKIRKLLRLARSANPHEAGIALAKAMALAQEHKLELDDVDPDQPDKPATTHRETPAFGRLSYDRKFALILTRRFFRVSELVQDTLRKTRYGYQIGVKIALIGTPSDCEIALYVYTFLVRHFAYCWNHHRGRCRNRAAFVRGMFEGIYDQLADAEPPAVDSARDPKAIEISRHAYIAEHFGKTKDLDTNLPDEHASAARYAGYVQGRRTEIRPAIRTEGPQVLALT
jgi:hypothetical protein